MNSLAKPAAVVALLNAWSVRIIGAIRRRLSGQTRGESGQVDSILVIRLDELGDFTLFSSILKFTGTLETRAGPALPRAPRCT